MITLDKEECLLQKLLENRPELLNKYSSVQYKLSKEILIWKHTNEYNVKDMAHLLDLSLEDYLKYESGYSDFTEEQYKTLLKKMREL